MTKAGVHGPTGDCGDEADGGVHGRTVVAAGTLEMRMMVVYMAVLLTFTHIHSSCMRQVGRKLPRVCRPLDNR